MKNVSAIVANNAAVKSLEKIWYKSEERKTSGPMTTMDLECAIINEETALVWWKGAPEWINVSKWREMRDEFIQSKIPVFYLEPEKLVPMSLEETICVVKSRPFLGAVKLWTAQSEMGLSVFELEDICNALGINGRKQKRVPFNGNIVLENGNVRLIAKVRSLSAGGVGAVVSPDVDLSGELLIRFHSQELMNVAPIKSELVFRKNDSAGFKFNYVDSESLSAIVSYLRKNEEKAA
jgi:hypothetical protein